MARRLFVAGRLRAGLMVTLRPGSVGRGSDTGAPVGNPTRSAPASPSSADPGHRCRSTFAVGRRSPHRSGVRAVQFPRPRPAPLPGPWSLAAVVTGEG